jgi:hypothetical protein
MPKTTVTIKLQAKTRLIKRNDPIRPFCFFFVRNRPRAFVMNVHPKRRPLRRKNDIIAWQTIDQLAMQLCPPDEWNAYMGQLNDLEWMIQQTPEISANLRVFPVWKKYRSQARQVAALYQAIPLLQRFPLRWTSLLGRILFQ